MTVQRARLARLVLLPALLFMSACEANKRPRGELRMRTESFTILISPEKRPTRALEPVYWNVVVHDRKTGTPIQGGQGRIFATSKDRKSIANGLEATDELGTYRTNLMYVTAGMWAHALQFRRDSTLPLERTEDWTQDILAADEPGGEIATPSSNVPDSMAFTTKDTTKDTTKRKEP